VGTESALDRSKPLKSFIMALFAESGNFDIEARLLPPRGSPPHRACCLAARLPV